MKDYYSKKEAKLVETGEIYEAVISLKEMEEAMQYMQKTEKESIIVFTICQISSLAAILAVIFYFGCTLLGIQSVLPAFCAAACFTASIAAYLFGNIAIPHPFGIRNLERALRLQEILEGENSPCSLKISTSGLMSVSTTEENKTHIFFEEYLKVEYADQDHIVVESCIEKENTSRNKPVLGYDIKIILPSVTQNER